MEEPLISVIVPVYNVGAYLTECLDSLLSQSYHNLEFICVDDGSTDNSGDICDAFAKQDNRFHVIHQGNAGAGAARNAGLKCATGDYIGFVDSDDYIDKCFYERLMQCAQANDAVIVSCETIQVYKDYVEKPMTSNAVIKYSGEEFLKLTADHWKYYIMVNKIFSKQVVADACFPEGNVIDDGFFTYQIISRADKIIWCDQALYFYRQRKSSAMNLPDYQRRRDYDAIDLLKEKLEYVKLNYPDAISAFQRKMLDSYLNIICDGHIDKTTTKSCIAYMRKNCHKALKDEYRGKEKLWWRLMLFFPEIMIQNRRSKVSNQQVAEQHVLFD